MRSDRLTVTAASLANPSPPENGGTPLPVEHGQNLAGSDQYCEVPDFRLAPTCTNWVLWQRPPAAASAEAPHIVR
jgi:hypothetical protein